jgi:ATP-dependent RNA helicase DeaD
MRVEYVTVVLQRFGYDADDISSDRPQKDREKVMERVRKGTLRFLVATDVAARGIDLPELSHVFQYEPPEDPEAYIHRAGRTGRAGGGGTAVSLVNRAEIGGLERISKRYAIQLQQRPLPTDDDVAQVVSERITALLEAKLRNRDKLQAERMRRFLPLARSLGESGEPDLLAMLLDDFYQETFHAPLIPLEEGVPTPAERAAGRSKRGKEGGRPRSGRRGGERPGRRGGSRSGSRGKPKR